MKMEKLLSKTKNLPKVVHLLGVLVVVFALLFIFVPGFLSSSVSYTAGVLAPNDDGPKKPSFEPLNKELYDQKMIELANNPPPKAPPAADPNTEPKPPVPEPVLPWPVKTVYPNDGAILPFKRIIAYYGNLYSKKMGVLGEYPEAEMLARLDNEVKKWEAADPATPVQPALHYIAVVAQGSAGADGMYRFRMPDSEVEKVLRIAEKAGAIVFLDFQVAFSTLEKELPAFEKYLKLPHVHLGIDPEFSMKSGIRPGKVVGSFDAADVNFAASFLARLVKENDLPPKVLVVHRYTQKMLTNYNLIKPLPEVQIVMHMDGWGPKAKKIGTYKQFVYKEPVQFTGFKLFYKNDLWDKGTTLFAPEELLKLNPRPIYIQYQ